MSENRDIFSEVRPKPGSLLDRCLKAISNPRKHRWNAYLRACRAIPKDSPVAGSTSWKRINARRHKLIDKSFRRRGGWKDEPKDPEFLALQNIAGELRHAGDLASDFIMMRWLRRRIQAAGKKKGKR